MTTCLSTHTPTHPTCIYIYIFEYSGQVDTDALSTHIQT